MQMKCPNNANKLQKIVRKTVKKNVRKKVKKWNFD